MKIFNKPKSDEALAPEASRRRSLWNVHEDLASENHETSSKKMQKWLERGSVGLQDFHNAPSPSHASAPSSSDTEVPFMSS